MHSLLRLPIDGENVYDLKEKTLSQLQDKLKGIKYIIIDEYSVIGQKMFEWIYRKLKQSSGLMDTGFGGFSIILVGDIAQLSPVLDKPLHCPVSEDPMTMMGFFAFRTIDHVAKLEQNVRASLADDRHEFRELLLRLHYGESLF